MDKKISPFKKLAIYKSKMDPQIHTIKDHGYYDKNNNTG